MGGTSHPSHRPRSHKEDRHLATRRPWPLIYEQFFPFMRLRMFYRSARCYCPPALLSHQRACPFAIVLCDGFPHLRPWPPWPCYSERLDTTVFKRAGGLLWFVTAPLTTSHLSLTMSSYRIERNDHVDDGPTATRPACGNRKESPTRG